MDVSALQDVALDALTNVHPDRADPMVLAKQINALAQFSVDATFTIVPDGFNRAVLAYAGDGDVIMKLAGQDEEITGGSVGFFPQKNGEMIAARLQHNGGETGPDILDAANDSVIAYRKVEENGAVYYEIVAEVDEAGQWMEYAGDQVKRYKESETIFAEAGEVDRAKNELREKALSAELLRSFGYANWQNVPTEQRDWLNSILNGTDLTGLQGEMQTAINNSTFYDVDG